MNPLAALAFCIFAAALLMFLLNANRAYAAERSRLSAEQWEKLRLSEDDGGAHW